MSDFEDFIKRREAGNAAVLDTKNLAIKRFFSLDKHVYGEGTALDVKTKELMGLTASMVLRCNDCIDYHIQRCMEEGCSKDEIDDAFSVALMVGGSIVIPHARHAAQTVNHLLAQHS